jgi:glycosyltransferase involved in cell wall biosynthesis
MSIDSSEKYSHSPPPSMTCPFPSISILVLVYNQRDLLDKAIASVLAQDCPPVEIILSDDCSSDGSFEHLQALAAQYSGPHHVWARQNKSNVGIGEHYNQLMAASKGELLITAAGDDLSTPDRVRRLVAAWDETQRQADLIASHVMDLDHQGHLHKVIRVDDLSLWRKLDDWVAKRPYIIGAGHAFTRRCMARFGPMLKGIAYEDQIMVFRALCMGGGITVDAPLVHYRRGGTSGRPTTFKSPQDRWTVRQTDRLVAEREQLIADAEIAGCGAAVRAMMELPMRGDRYMRALQQHSPHWSACWQALKDAAPLPLGWRLRKLLHATFPKVTLCAKSMVQPLHRRYWRARREAKRGGA